MAQPALAQERQNEGYLRTCAPGDEQRLAPGGGANARDVGDILGRPHPGVLW